MLAPPSSEPERTGQTPLAGRPIAIAEELSGPCESERARREPRAVVAEARHRHLEPDDPNPRRRLTRLAGLPTRSELTSQRPTARAIHRVSASTIQLDHERIRWSPPHPVRVDVDEQEVPAKVA